MLTATAPGSVLDLFRLTGRVAIVTGGGSGLGAGFARALAEAGADVVLERQRGQTRALVNNAGVSHVVPASTERPENFRSVVEVNLIGAYWAAQACARVMRSG